jgi:hypothetical protein
LKSFSLPIGKTPLFIGGSGVTVEDIDGDVRACVYPVAENASATLTLPESETSFTIHVAGLAPGIPWSGVRVTDSKSHTVPITAAGHAFVFTPLPGEHYRVQALP